MKLLTVAGLQAKMYFRLMRDVNIVTFTVAKRQDFLL